MDANEQKARELLAAAMDEGGRGWEAAPIRAGDNLIMRSEHAIRAIMAALAQQVPADGEWVPEAELLALVAGPYMYHHKMDEAAMREARAFDRCRELTIQNIQTWCAMRRAMLAATTQAPQPVVDGTIGQQAVDVAAHEALTLLEQATCHDGRYGQMERIGWQESAQKLLPRLRAALAAHGKPND